jgi:hypothetical protein
MVTKDQRLILAIELVERKQKHTPEHNFGRIGKRIAFLKSRYLVYLAQVIKVIHLIQSAYNLRHEFQKKKKKKKKNRRKKKRRNGKNK